MHSHLRQLHRHLRKERAEVLCPALHAAGSTTRAHSCTRPPRGAQRRPQPLTGAVIQPIGCHKGTTGESTGKDTGMALGSPRPAPVHIPSMGGSDPHPHTGTSPPAPRHRMPAHLSPTPLSGRCPQRSPQHGMGCGMPACGRRGSRHGGVSASPVSTSRVSAELGSRLCFLMEHRRPSEGRESTAPECGL